MNHPAQADDAKGMTDAELTEAAAKAIGLEGDYSERWGGFMSPATVLEPDDGYTFWNPLHDDSDALGLVRRLLMEVHFLPDAIRCRVPGGEWIGETVLACDTEHLGNAQRRAIVRAAAALHPDGGNPR
jgi:hypothetical protein